ncbi:MAG: MFS transporter [Alphaproteobacteria bacterium]|nr:MFS transporter [Alphaproteobacteria bacterium]
MQGLEKQIPAGSSDRSASAFCQPSGRRRYVVACVLTFLMFLGNAGSALLAPILQAYGLTQAQVGAILSLYGISAIFGTLVSGAVAQRIGALATVRVAAWIFLAAYLSFHSTASSPIAAAASRLLQGLGYGLFLPSAMVYAKAQLSTRRAVYFFGIFSSMIPMPNIVGPSISSALLDRFGADEFFPLTAIPIVLAALGFLFARADAARPGMPNSGYLAVLGMRSVRVAFVAILVTGLLFGIVPSYMAELMLSRGLPVGLFFSTFTVVLFGARFTLLSFFERATRQRVVAFAIGLMSLAYAMLCASPTAFAAVGGGLAFGLGYSLAYPRLSIWVSDRFGAEDRDKPIGLFNAFFTFGTYLNPLLIGTFRTAIGVEGVMAGLAGIGFICATAILWTRAADR